MNPIINHLIQLQELSLIRTEQQAQRRGANLEELDLSIQKLTAQLPPDVRSILERMQKKDALFIVPVANFGCVGCGMKLPISLMQAVQKGEMVQHCPICARMLYMPDSPPHHVGKAPRRCEPRKPGISRFSAQSLMIHRLAGADRDSVIRELAQRIQSAGFVDNAEKLFQAAIKREAIVSTAVEPCMAFPHARGVEGGGLTLALGLSPKGVKFDDKSAAKLIFFLVIPTAASAFYLKLLAGLAETFVDSEARKLLMSAEDEEKMWKALLKATKKTIV
jgi:mannitol/fructose-specific phosphotransferase system IIA component (Ntr-type)